MSSSELVAACLARIHAAGRVAQPRRRSGLDQRVGARVRGGRGRGRGAGRRASERGRRATRRPGSGADRDPARAQGSLRRRGKATHRVEPSARRTCRRRTATPGGGWPRRDGAARPSAHARVRRRRHDGPGRQPVGPRAIRRRLERRLGGGAGGHHGSRRHRHRHRGIAPHPVRLLRHLGDQADAWRGSRLAGVVPLAWSLDHAGPMARTLADCRLLLAAMAGPDRGRAESALHAPAPDAADRSRARPAGSPGCGWAFLRARRERSSTPTWRRASSSRSRRAVASVQCSSSRRPPRGDRRRATTSSTS